MASPSIAKPAVSYKRQAGSLRGLTVDACATIWALAYANYKLDLGRWPTQAEYAEYWNTSERSAQREWANFRNAFPSEVDPENLARWLTSEVAARIEDRSTALSVQAPPELVPA